MINFDILHITACTFLEFEVSSNFYDEDEVDTDTVALVVSSEIIL